MPAFKPKSNKKIQINKKSSITLDGKHREFLNEFATDEVDRIPLLKEEKRILKKILEENENATLEEKLDAKDKITEINEKIKYIRNKKKEYYLDNSKFIFDYFENKKSISTGGQNASKNKLVDSFFKIKQEDSSSNDCKTNNIVKKYLSNHA